MKKSVYALLVILFAAITVKPLGVSFAADDTVRVAIIDDKQSVSLSLKGRYKISTLDSDRVLMSGPYLSAKVTASRDGLDIGNKGMNISGLRVEVEKDSNIYVDNRRFRGGIDIVRKDNSKIIIINRLGLDEYLYGVLYHEVSHRWPMEALKAQAIAARTFALYQMKQNKLQPYDLRCDIYSQMYGGRTSEKWSTNAAVNATKGMVLTYNGEILPAYYHATCAGHTEDAVNLWNVDMPPLKGVECGYCTASPHYRWRKEIALDVVEDKLRGGGYKIGSIESVAVLSRNASGRIDKIELDDKAGVSAVLTGKDFRQLMGPNEVRSTNFSVSIKWNSLVLDGSGWGHGVGMCQWGAYGMSRQHKKAEDILKHYYPGAEITVIDKLGK